MIPPPAYAPGTAAAGEIDIAYHAASNQVLPVSFNHGPHKLMAGHSFKAVIAPQKLNIGTADAGQCGPNQSIATGPWWPRHLADLDFSLMKVNAKHIVQS